MLKLQDYVCNITENCFSTVMPIYTAISFAPVQGFIEKSRKLRDLFGASLILSYLSQSLANAADQTPELKVISPALIHVQEGMPNRILIQGLFPRNEVEKVLIQAWDKVLQPCREWIETNVPVHDLYHWDAEWLRWKQYTWEIFWGKGDDPSAAMNDLERRKLKRDWVGINWTGESSSLTGTDAIAWHRLGEVRDPKHLLSEAEKRELKEFYRQLAWVLDDPHQRCGKIVDAGVEPEGKFIAANERLSLPELIKRLVTLPKLAKKIGLEDLAEGFKDIYREPGYWTGWFMGDGDQIGNKLKDIVQRYGDEKLEVFSHKMRSWGQTFQDDSTQFPQGKGRVIYAGGDDFLGVIYSEQNQSGEPAPEQVKPIDALNWLMQLPDQWQTLKTELWHDLEIEHTYSVGFVWAGHSVPQRDILQHCREAEKQAKSLGRDRVTIRIVFNNGQFIQWTCPWSYLSILTKYQDREGRTWGDAKLNWTHLYSDWEQLKARHAIRLTETDQYHADSYLALQLFNFYFDDAGKAIQKNPQDKRWKYLVGSNSELAIVQWIDSLIQIGWQLCSNI
ncbi:hypothetical protein NIES2135_64420 (plasmid) [Leptolyngbya boryana NIES-2135]|uniref:Uncharacterized protein n=2 Tax=Leptolyngbya group TaxID=3081713 RepID=A0A1Z4JS25_LEPBY|nr:hypothetical protein NIES2135_64420 [Leptolyngbya boryana NIES-2135]